MGEGERQTDRQTGRQADTHTHTHTHTHKERHRERGGKKKKKFFHINSQFYIIINQSLTTIVEFNILIQFGA